MIECGEIEKLFEYKRWANRELLNKLDQLAAEQGEDSVRNSVRILNHTHVVDQIFAAHLRGEKHGFGSTNTERTPTVCELDASISELDDWFVDYVLRLRPDQFGESLAFRFTDGDVGQMSRGQMLMHLLNHGSYHRGAVGQILKDQGHMPPADTLARYLRGSSVVHTKGSS